MSATANTFGVTDSALLRHPWVAWLHRELIPLPGRATMTTRLVISVVLVTIISMALQIPQLPFSAFIIFFVTKENRALTLLTGIMMIIGITIAMATTLVLYQYTFDYPEWRFPALALLIFTGMFLSRTFVLGPLGFIVGFYVALTQTISEGILSTDVLVRSILWLWVAIVYPIVITIVINQVILPAHPWDALVGRLRIRLDFAKTALRRCLETGVAGGQDNPQLLELVTRGSSTLFALLNFSESEDPRLKLRHASVLATIGAAEHVLNATASLELRPAYTLSAEDLACARELLAEIEYLETALSERHPQVPITVPAETKPGLPHLHELQFAVRSLRASLVREIPGPSAPAPEKPKTRLFIPDAFTNPAHVRFALKVTLGAMICYLIYNGLHWPGISTSFVTCCFIALENTGATIRKGVLRLAGCALGGLAGFLSIFFLVPHMQSIVSLVLLVAIFTAIAGWIAAGTDRVSYAGLQAAFAFYLSLFLSFEPQVNFTIIRDRLVGITLGIIVASIVFRYLWPEHAIDSMRLTLARILRNISKLVLLPKVEEPCKSGRRDITTLQAEITKDMDNTLRLSELVVIEGSIVHHANGVPPETLERMTAHTQSLYLMATVLLGPAKLEEWRRLEPPVQTAEQSLRVSTAAHLQRLASYIETNRPPPPDDLPAALNSWDHAAANVTANDRPRLVRRLIGQVQLVG
jgi:multidrug resistance protein MdtO